MKPKPNAQEQFERSNSLLAKKTTFAEAYGEIVETFDLQVHASTGGFGETANYHYSITNPPAQYCGCPNPLCSGGGFNIGSFVYELISGRLTEGETTGRCVGREQAGKKMTRTCLYHFTARATVTYKAHGANANDGA